MEDVRMENGSGSYASLLDRTKRKEQTPAPTTPRMRGIVQYIGEGRYVDGTKDAGPQKKDHLFCRNRTGRVARVVPSRYHTARVQSRGSNKVGNQGVAARQQVRGEVHRPPAACTCTWAAGGVQGPTY